MRYTAKQQTQAAKGRLDAIIISDAKRFGHHGPADLIRSLEARHAVTLAKDETK